MGSGTRVPAAEPTALAVISWSGGLGARLRHLVGMRRAPHPNRIPLAPFGINGVQCISIGFPMVPSSERWVAHRLLQPFLAVGLLGGRTTFATYGAQVRRLVRTGTAHEAVSYLGGTVVIALGAVVPGMGPARWITGTPAADEMTHPRRKRGWTVSGTAAATALPGAPVRAVVDRAVAARFSSLLPLGTLTVNIVGSALLGALIGAGANKGLLAVAGFSDALTTFATFGSETTRLVADGAYAAAVGAAIAAASVTEWLWT